MKAAPIAGVVARVKWETAWKVLGSVSAAQKTLSLSLLHSYFIGLLNLSLSCYQRVICIQTCLRSALLFLWLWSFIFTKNWKIFVKIKSSSAQKFPWVLETKKRSQIWNFWSWKRLFYCLPQSTSEDEWKGWGSWKILSPQIFCSREGHFSGHILIHAFYKIY